MTNKKLLIIFLAFLGFGMKAQVGLNCQFVPGIQLGSVKVKSTNAKLDYKYSAGLPLFMIDRFKGKWYTNLDMNATYYAATQTNKANADKIKIAKTEGGLIAGRLGYGFGKGETTKFGINGNLGYSVSNLDSSRKAFNVAGYWNYGGGVFFYQKIGTKMRAMAKIGYEKYGNGKSSTGFTKQISELRGSGFYLEGTLGYNIYQKFGIAVMPTFTSKKFNFKFDGTPTTSKVTAFALRIGIVKFF